MFRYISFILGHIAISFYMWSSSWSFVQQNTKWTSRRNVIRSTAALSIVSIAGCVGSGSDDDAAYPAESIRAIVPYSEGGGTDVMARNFAGPLSDDIGVDLEIENITGAGTLRASGEAILSDPDGYTMLFMNPPDTVLPALINEPDQDVRELTGVAQYSRSSFVLATRPEDEVESYDDLLDRFEDGEFTSVGGAGPASPFEVCVDVAESQHGLSLEQNVSFDGGADAVQSVMAGDIDVAIGSDINMEPWTSDDDVEVSTVFFSDGSPIYPDVESVTDLGYDNIDFIGAFTRGLYMPPDTPLEIRERIHEGIISAWESNELQEWAEETGVPEDVQGPEEVDEALAQAFEEVPNAIDIDDYR